MEQLEGENVAFTPPGQPGSRAAGRKGQWWPATLTAIVVEPDTDPLVPVMVTVDEPEAAEADAESVNVEVQDPAQLEGENVAVTPRGSPEAEKVGLALPVTVAVMVLVADPPSASETDAGLADSAMGGMTWATSVFTSTNAPNSLGV